MDRSGEDAAAPAAEGTTAPPAAALHLRCGDDLRERLPAAGVGGTYLSFADPVCQGPTWDDGDLLGFIARRARFVAAHYGADAREVRLRLGAEYAALHSLPREGAIRLWFGHDLWDQAALIRVLSLLADTPASRAAGRLWLMPADGTRSFPELPDAELAALAPTPLTEAQLDCGAEAWAAFSAEEPTALDALSRRALPLPHLARALRRHLQDLPWTTDGLALSERLVLEAVRDGAADPAAVFRALRAADPVFHVTDLIAADLLRRLQEGARRLVTRGPAGAPLALTPRGRAVLAGEERHIGAPRFLGGVAVGPGSPWRWDPVRAGVA